MSRRAAVAAAVVAAMALGAAAYLVLVPILVASSPAGDTAAADAGPDAGPEATAPRPGGAVTSAARHPITPVALEPGGNVVVNIAIDDVAAVADIDFPATGLELIPHVGAAGGGAEGVFVAEPGGDALARFLVAGAGFDPAGFAHVATELLRAAPGSAGTDVSAHSSAFMIRPDGSGRVVFAVEVRGTGVFKVAATQSADRRAAVVFAVAADPDQARDLGERVAAIG